MYNQELTDLDACDAAGDTFTTHSPEEQRLRLVEAEARWEVEGVRRGVERFRRMIEGKQVDELGPGQRLLRELVPAVVARIKKLAEEPFASRDGLKARRDWAELLLLLPPDELAVLTVTAVLRATIDQDISKLRHGGPATIRSMAMRLSAAVRDQIEYQRWSAEQKELRKLSHGADERLPDLLKALQARYPTVTRSVWAKWRRKVDVAREVPWRKDVSIGFGGALIHCLVEARPDDFKLAQAIIKGGRTENVVQISARLTEELQDRMVRSEVARPAMMPMICPPNDWRYVQ